MRAIRCKVMPVEREAARTRERGSPHGVLSQTKEDYISLESSYAFAHWPG